MKRTKKPLQRCFWLYRTLYFVKKTTLNRIGEILPEQQYRRNVTDKTSVSETMRKPPLIKAQTAFKINKKNKYGKNDFQYGGWNSYTLQCGTIMTLISPGARWHVALTWHVIEFASWQHSAMWHVALESWQWICQVAAPCNVAGGSGVTCHWIRPNVRHIGILLLVSISTISPQSTCHSAPVCEILFRSDHPRQKKMTQCRF